MASLTIVGLVSLAASTMTSARLVNLDAAYFPTENLLVYRLFWWPVGVLFSLTLTWGAVRVVTSMRSGREADVDRRRTWLPLVAGLVVGVVLLAPVGYRRPPEGIEVLYDRDLDHAEAIADLPGSPSAVVLRFWPEGSTPATQSVPEYGYSTGLVAQLRLRGIVVRFPEDTDERGTFALAYRNEHRVHGNESVVLLYRVGPVVYLDPPLGYRRISVSGPGPGEPFHSFSIPSAIYVPS